MSAPSTTTTTDGSEDVNDFLQRIKELGDKRDQEDEERSRKLEEEILQGRKERQARRAERARSISPTKSSPASTPTASRASGLPSKNISETLSPTIGPPKDSEFRRGVALDDAMDKLTGISTSPTKENSSPFDSERNIGMKPTPSSAMPSRGSPLSWQRRPNSQASDHPRSRPLSMVATENAARSPRATPEPTSATEPTFSRDQIAQSLSSKDPAWFRQTADRGLKSPAFRKNQVEDEDRSDHSSVSAKVQMPGMSREISTSHPPTEELPERSTSPSRGSIGSGASYQAGFTTATSLGSPMPLTPAQKLDPPTEMRSDSRTMAMSPSQGRISPERLDRPASPTKGMGGFVQSAMMKRSDSVNKRWSVQAPPGLSRGNSVASNRSNADHNNTLSIRNVVGAPRHSKPPTLSRDSSPRPNSRPSSSHSNATVTQDRPGTASSMRSSITTSTTNEGFIKPPLPTPTSRAQTPSGVRPSQSANLADTPTRSETTPPTSPSKTMDSRRWSPTKSSWLESALNKPDSPKPKAVPPPQQPAWMSEINKAKQRASVDLGRAPAPGPKHEVNIGGLMRSPPLGGIIKPASISGLPAGFPSGPISRTRQESVTSQATKDLPKPSESSGMSATSSTPSGTPTGIGKIKPETPPKKDFRATLKSRKPASEASGATEPEFKNVFGQLKRTKTQNYVAPDELKDNITRGKQALNLTGGPKKTERKDEFKDAILKKKDDFKKAQYEGRGVSRSTSGGSQDAPLPEALARRKTLGKSDFVTTGLSSGILNSPSSQQNDMDSPIPGLVKETSAPGRLQAKEPAVSKLAGRLNPSLANLLARGPPTASNDTPPPSGPDSSLHAAKIPAGQSNNEAPQLTHMTKSRARGPRRKAPTSTAAVTKVDLGKQDLDSDSEPVSMESPVQESRVVLATKSITQDSASQAEIENDGAQPPSPRKLDLKRRSQFLQEVPNKNPKAELQLGSPKPLSPTKKANSIEIPVKGPALRSKASDSSLSRVKPTTPIKSPSLSSKSIEKSPITSPTSPTNSSNASRFRPSPLSPKPNELISSKETYLEMANPRPLPILPVKAIGLNDSKMKIEEKKEARPAAVRDYHEPVQPSLGSTSVRSAASIWNQSSGTNGNDAPPRVRSPIKLPTQADEKAALIGAGLRPASPVKEEVPSRPQVHSSTAARALPIPPLGKVSSPPLSGGLSPHSDASHILSDFFIKQSPSTEFRVDTATLLSARPLEGDNIKTLRSSLYQMSNDGNKQLVPNHQERILFEGNLYLCTHTYGNAAGKKVTEVYFWQGDDVPKQTVDQVKIFAQKEAKSAGGILVMIPQGKETPEFFHALGGIIIIRRGSSNKYDSLAPHILCCRRHFGQIVFDEVDFSPASLCSGFPYLISTQSGKSFLWKGKGSGVEELSCARLIGMDFGLTGEVEEVDDGSEPPAFLKVFDDAFIPKSADHWRMKPNYSKYCTRLFRANSKTREQITELNPFCQTDLDWSSIFILDAFFEIYIIVGSTAQAEYTSLQHALLFAQEYGILAAGMEDRPFVPVTTVVLEGVPKDMRSVFRKWASGLSPTTHQIAPVGNLRRGRSLRVLPLNAALDATRS